jgi:hypothetical protein
VHLARHHIPNFQTFQPSANVTSVHFSSARALTLGDCETEIFAVGAIQKYACAHYSRLQHIFAPIHPCFFQIKFFQAIPQPRRANLLGLKNDLYVRTTAP